MAVTIKLRAGNRYDNSLEDPDITPELAEREIVYFTDERQLAVKTENGIVTFANADELEKKLTAKKVAKQGELAYMTSDSDTVKNLVSAFNYLIDAMKTSGVMFK